MLITLPKYASEHNLASIGDLKPLNNKFTIGGAPELATREEGLPGIKKLYGVEGKFKPVSIELSYQAIEGGQVDVQSVFSTDGQLLGGKFKTLVRPEARVRLPERRARSSRRAWSKPRARRSPKRSTRSARC